MSKEQALYQSLASSGAVLIVFVGVCHECIGDIVFPWGPALLGGPIGWNGLGLLCIVSGLLFLGGTLRLFRFPVAPFALLTAAIGVVFLALTAVLHHEFHIFALATFLSGVSIAYFHRKAGLSA